jgi:hypothetical protein
MDNSKVSPKDFFLHLGVIATLYTIAISFINLAWRIIDFAFPSETFHTRFYGGAISGPVATLIIVFPVFILLSWLLNKEYKSTPEKRRLWIRKWLVYITLFIAGVVIIVDLIVVLISFLGGEIITSGFILKALSVLLLALAIFGYYIADLRDKITQKRNRTCAWISAIVVLGLIAAGFSIMGSPRTQRLLRYDEQKVSDLQNIQWQIVNFWQQKEELPETLNELGDPISGFIAPLDPQTKESYQYEITGKFSFKLCAEFNLPSRDESSNMPKLTRPVDPGFNMEQNVWTHGEGQHCFERDIDPELYPPYSKF